MEQLWRSWRKLLELSILVLEYFAPLCELEITKAIPDGGARRDLRGPLPKPACDFRQARFQAEKNQPLVKRIVQDKIDNTRDLKRRKAVTSWQKC